MRKWPVLILASLLVTATLGCTAAASHSALDVPSDYADAYDMSGADIYLLVLSLDDSRTVALDALERMRASHTPHWQESAFLARSDGFRGLEPGKWLAAVPVSGDRPPARLISVLGSKVGVKASLARVRVRTNLPLYPQSWSIDGVEPVN